MGVDEIPKIQIELDSNSVKSSSSLDTQDIEILSLYVESIISNKSYSTINLSSTSLAIETKTIDSTSETKPKKNKNFIESVRNFSFKQSVIKLYRNKEKVQPFIPNEKQKEREDAFLGYYECYSTGNSKLSIPKFSLSTARIDLHNMRTLEAKHLVLTKVKQSPYIGKASIFIITGKHDKIDGGSEYSGKMYNLFPEWMQDESIKYLIDEEPVRGLGTYEVFINKHKNEYDEITEETLKDWEKRAKQKNDVTYKMALAGFYLKGNKEDHNKARRFYVEAAKLNSCEAKLCLGYMYSIGKSEYNPKKAEKLFIEIINSKKRSKLVYRLAMRNIAILHHNNYVIESFKLKILLKSSKLKTAIKWYKKSFKAGDGQSAYHLGLLYESNNGIKEDKDEAEKWFSEGAKLNNLYAKAKYGRILANKEGVNENERKKAIQMLKDTAKKGLVMGQTFLGEYYEKKKNYEEAVKYYSESAMQNHGYYSHVAQFRIKELYAEDFISKVENLKYILNLYEKELKYYYNGHDEILKKIH
ncbi:15722_t:CDS:1 [Funneliformis geosporum]|uniref:13787_t:CDS:1 n=1 Tax=Funneliformis geosporum TaxID=1117311 RepID=A0A9W4WTY3_9GLOM|nr:15722_t:CDS:1 [Funneliformis geosporum]CAI2178736.1 13787_t:CDS:1 [Funneliformis geosporum]